MSDPRVRDRLEVALHGRGAFRRFKSVLLEYLDERERWFAFQDKRIREAMREWLEENNIEPTTEPPKKKTSSQTIGLRSQD